MRERWPAWAMKIGAVAGALGMIAGQIAQGAGIGAVVTTGVFAVAVAVVIWLLALGDEARLRRPVGERVPAKQPSKLAVVGLMVTAIVLGLTAAYGIFIAAITTRPENKWHALAYAAFAVCASGATVMLRRVRQEWDERYLKDWHAEG